MAIDVCFFRIARGTEEELLPPDSHTFEVQVEKDMTKVRQIYYRAGFVPINSGLTLSPHLICRLTLPDFAERSLKVNQSFHDAVNKF